MARLRAIRRPRRTVQLVVLAMLAGLLTVLALQHEGVPIRDVELNDGGVWVTNESIGMMARLNSQIDELEVGIVTSSTSTAVFQTEASVQVYDDAGGGPNRSVSVVDVRSGVAASVALPASYEAVGGGDTVAVLDDESGRVWIRRSDRVEGFDSTPADVEVSPRSSVTVTPGGTVLVLDRARSEVTAWSLDAQGLPVAGDVSTFEGEFLDDPALTAVGSTPVVLTGDKVMVPDEEPVRVDGEDAVLQQVGPDADRVVVATRTGARAVPLSGGGAEALTAPEVDGEPAAPAVVAGCVHLAWRDPGTENYQRLCEDADPFAGEIAPITDSSRLIFRSNRDLVVLNDVATGSAWKVQEDGLTRISDWDSVDPNAKDPQKSEADDIQPNQQRNQPPEAVDDEFGARPGHTVILPVTLNDLDPDGDILTLAQPPASQEQAAFSVVGDGTQVQAKISPNARGKLQFDYEITDGRPGNRTSKATVTLTLYDDATDSAPGLLREDDPNELRVAAGHSATTNVLPEWIDPEGDSLALVGATSEGGEIGFRPDGTIDFTDDGEGTGVETIEIKVRGGGEVAEGVVNVTVEDPETAAPVAVADHFSGVVGAAVLLEPLRNDTDPLGGHLVVPTLDVAGGAAVTLTKDPDRGTASFRAEVPGTYYLSYVAASENGQQSPATNIRVDVQPVRGGNRAPVATRDTAAVTPDGSALVDVLANDSDPDGDVLVVQGIEVPPAIAGSVRASLINKRFVRVQVVGDIGDGTPEIDYLLSDGHEQVRGAVAITRVDQDSNRPPVAVEDVVTARAGTVIDVPVLDNDTDPDGDKLSVAQQDLFDVDVRPIIADGLVPVIATGDSIRVLVPDDGTTQLQIGYGVRDRDGSRADNRLVLNIKPDDPKDNQAPQPPPLEDRTVTGHPIRVPVDVFGADPDGDPVVLSSVVEPPKYGRITRSGADWFEYEPYEGENSTGTDTFKIEVRDPYGLSANVDVRIGVAERSARNQAPAALDDVVQVKPGLTLGYPVLGNDSDPDGDPLILEGDSLRQPGGSTGAVRVAGSAIEVDVPDREVTTTTEYTVTDGLGASSSAFLSVTASEDAPDHAPITADDVAEASQLEGKQAGDTIDIDVLANDGDLDGDKADLVLSAVDATASSVVDGELRVVLDRTSQVLAYQVTDATGQSSFGLVYVAGTDSLPPTLDPDAVPVEVMAGEPTEIALADVVVVRADRSPKIEREDQVIGSRGDVRVIDEGAVEFSAPRSYYGPASITMGVIDGTDLNDPEGLSSQITIPITVLPAENVAPEVRSADVTVYAGGEPVEIDLDRLATDVNPDDDLDFTVEPEIDDLDVEISGDTLRIGAVEGAMSAVEDLTVSADDGSAAPATGVVTVTVVGVDDEAGAQPLMRVRDLAVDGEADTPITVDLSDAVIDDPVPEGNKIVDATVTGPASAPRINGTTLAVTPSGAGEVVVTVTLDDGSGEVGRYVDARVVITVADVPGKPNPPRGVKGGADSVQLTWQAPVDNGSPIDHYVVRWSGGDQECRATQCLITDLDPGTDYRFTVEAVNDIGAGEPSNASAPVTPDQVPDAMSAPTIDDDYTDRNGQLTLHWTPPTNEGSDITGYKITSVPATRTQTVGAADRSYTWTGLQNGTSYRFRILAVNDEGDGPVSPLSASAEPFTKPDTMAAPDISVDPPNGDGQGYLTVSWPALVAPGNGHDDILTYDVKLFRDGQELTTVAVGGTETSRSFTVENGHEYSAQVRATNRAGPADSFSPSSEAKIAWDKSSAPTNLATASDCVNCTTSTTSYRGRLSFTTPADDGGYPVTGYLVEVPGRTPFRVNAPTQAEGAPATLDLDFAGTTPGQQVTLTPLSTVPGQGEVAGTPATGGNFSPYAKPIAPSGSATGGEMQVSFSWNGGSGNGRTVTATGYRVVSGGSGTGTAGAGGGSTTIDTNKGGVSVCIQVRASTSAGGWSDWSGNICDSSNAPTLEVYFVNAGTDIPESSCARPCYYTKFKVTGFAQGTYDASRYAYGPGDCQSTGFSKGWSYTVGADGRGGPTNNRWWISSTCDADSVTTNGMTTKKNIP